jgi:hypothetical protein
LHGWSSWQRKKTSRGYTSGLLVKWRPNDPFADDDNPDYLYTPDVDDDDDDSYLWDDSIEDDITITTNNTSANDHTSLIPASDGRIDLHINTDAITDTEKNTVIPHSPTSPVTVTSFNNEQDEDGTDAEEEDNFDSLFDHPDGFLDDPLETQPSTHVGYLSHHTGSCMCKRASHFGTRIEDC